MVACRNAVNPSVLFTWRRRFRGQADSSESLCSSVDCQLFGPPRKGHAFGHGHTEMAAGPMTGRIVTGMITGPMPNIDVTPYRADRF